ncbi:MAG: hypothetical protein H6573_32370 [Lewinellaceae bacterium]|nr:hypothetical protein [Phaeodactylibacter sp.]MCB9352155.1 hypothetical protein [Lewinellaceae bacterium]
MDTTHDNILAYLKSRSIELPEAGLQEALLDTVTLQAPMDFSGLDYKWVSLRRKEDGSVEALSLKPYNMLQANQRELRRKLLSIGAQGVLLTSVSGLLSVAASLLLLILEFEEVMAHDFSEEQARVLLAVYFADERLAEDDIQQAYRRCHGKGIEQDALQENLAILERIRTIRRKGKGRWELLETIIFRRDG